MIVYLDTSAFVKLYATESGSSKVHQIVQEASSITISEIGIVEMYSALFRKASYENIPIKRLEKTLQELERDWESVGRIRFATPVIKETKKLVKRFLLRSYDAIHLASAVIVSNSLGQRIGFLSFDDELNQAAKRCRLLKVL